MSRNGRVIVAMSGGVDSSVAACLLKERGYDCIGVFMRVGVEHEEEQESCAPAADAPAAATRRRLRHGCCSATDAMDARTVAGKLGIPFYALNFRKDFDRIIDYFVDEYAAARTPNPCVMCNIHLKFGRLLRYADAMDAEFVATGHYARIVERDGEARLARARNTAKDQSYVLFGIRRQDLVRCFFPLGEIVDKAEVRAIAARLGLSVHDKPDSQEICFVPENDYARLVQQRRPDTTRPGEIRDSSGRRLGSHNGLASYTIGQRRGLGLAVGLPVYVTRLDPDTNTVFVGGRDELLRSEFVARDVNWLAPAPDLESSVKAAVKIRHMHAPGPAAITRLSDETVRCIFDEPQSAVTPGQAAVFYSDDVVLGGGWIA